MNPPIPKIMSTDRVRQRFSEEQIRHLVERSLFKMSECPEQVVEWVSHYRTVYGEVTVVYAKEPHAAIVAYDDEMPETVQAKAANGTGGVGYRLSEEEWQKHAQAMWQATGGKFDAPLPRPDHKDGSGNDCGAWRREIVYDGGPYRRGLLRGHTYRKSSRARSDTSSSAILGRIGILQPV